MSDAEQLELVARLAYAGLLGGFIGLERELRGYPAGVRTIALVALGAAFFTEVSRVSGPEDRIAAGIVTGIGFVGAGLIFREGYTIRGITTAATVWVSAAVGMAVARDLLLAAGLGTVLIVAWLESRPAVRALTGAIRRLLPGAFSEDDTPEEHYQDRR